MIAPVLLAAVALWAAGRPVDITPTTDSWLGGHASVYASHVWVGESTLEAAAQGDPLALTVVLHEIGHTVGIASERQAMCFALSKLPGALTRFYGLRFRTVMFDYQRAAAYVAGLPPKYSRGACPTETQ